ncbi:transcription regulator complex subunit bur6 [Tribolium madens]|uniref:transcription regulator complex subunit bur6 n=1 Tax=Tribolium madens TaxID=41895 RepID=UPI001CF74A38|nr:transcription regulator complex subunit bur6 [Tribolium madens]
MPSKKKKYNARFPAGRIKKIMQTDEEVGKVAQAVPVIISRTLELFVESLLTKSMQITQSRNAKTLTPSHMKQCILSESRFDFLKDLVKNIPDASAQEDNKNNLMFEAQQLQESESKQESQPALTVEVSKPEVPATLYTEQSTSTARTPVIQYGPKVAQVETKKFNFSVNNLIEPAKEGPKVRITVAEPVPVPPLVPTRGVPSNSSVQENTPQVHCDNIPPLIPISHHYYNQNTEDNLCIDEDYDN